MKTKPVKIVIDLDDFEAQDSWHIFNGVELAHVIVKYGGMYVHAHLRMFTSGCKTGVCQLSTTVCRKTSDTGNSVIARPSSGWPIEGNLELEDEEASDGG